MTRTQIYLPEQLVFQLKLRAKANNQSMSEIIRKILNESIDKERRAVKIPKKLKTIRLNRGKTNIALHHNDIYD